MTAIETVSAANATQVACRSDAVLEQGAQRQRVAEEEGEDDGDRDRGEVGPVEGGGADEAEDLADRAAGQAVPGGGERGAVKRRVHVASTMSVLHLSGPLGVGAAAASASSRDSWSA
jgi:hypothetical protein